MYLIICIKDWTFKTNGASASLCTVAIFIFDIFCKIELTYVTN